MNKLISVNGRLLSACSDAYGLLPYIVSDILFSMYIIPYIVLYLWFFAKRKKNRALFCPVLFEFKSFIYDFVAFFLVFTSLVDIVLFAVLYPFVDSRELVFS